MDDSSIVPKTAIVKLNGGLGTSMGCLGPKSLIKCTEDGRTFLDVIIQQFQQVNDIASRLILLNSFNTSSDTIDYLNSKWSGVNVVEVLQYPFRRVDADSKQPLSMDTAKNFNPPGHGSIYYDLYYSGELQKCIDQGIEYLFISNSDNLAATFDPKIASYLRSSNTPFLIELTEKTSADVKGGTIVRCDDGLKLWEIAQVNESDLDLFMKQPYFNTNNIWVHIPTLLNTIQSKLLSLDLILNQKSIDSKNIIQLEYAMGSAIQSFKSAKALIVPRSRFFPIKKVSDYLLLISDYTTIDDHGDIFWDLSSRPMIHCYPPFDTISAFHDQITVIPSLKDIKELTIGGDLHIHDFIRFKGVVNLLIPPSYSFQPDPSEHSIIENLSIGFSDGDIFLT